jgi:hypothetical protein
LRRECVEAVLGGWARVLDEAGIDGGGQISIGALAEEAVAAGVVGEYSTPNEARAARPILCSLELRELNPHEVIAASAERENEPPPRHG